MNPPVFPSETAPPGEMPLSNSEAQVWKSHNFSITADAGDEPDAVIFRLVGPFTARDMYSSLSPSEVRQIFETLPAKKKPSAQIFDLSGVPYMDSVGLGMLVRLYVSSRNNGIRMSICGCTPHVLELLKLTKMDSVLPIEN
jgi:anti-anti-sigma factor